MVKVKTGKNLQQNIRYYNIKVFNRKIIKILINPSLNTLNYKNMENLINAFKIVF